MSSAPVTAALVDATAGASEREKESAQGLEVEDREEERGSAEGGRVEGNSETKKGGDGGRTGIGN